LNRVPPEDATRAYEAAEHKFKVQIRKDNNMHRKFFHLWEDGLYDNLLMRWYLELVPSLPPPYGA